MKQYKDLNLKEIAQKSGLDFAHWSCRGTCSCCVDPMDFPQKFFSRPKSEINDDNLQYLIFKNAHNGSGDVDKNHVICYQSFEHGKEVHSRLYPVFIGWKFEEQKLDTVIELLQEQLGDKYKVIRPKDSSETIKIQPLFTSEEADKFLETNNLPR